jgi:hypothetical protein
MRRSIAATAFIALALLSPAALAAAPPSPNVPCQMPGSDVATFLSVDNIPAPIKLELATFFGNSDGKLELAARNANFRESNFTASSDTSLPYARFVQAGHTGTRWYVWYELRGQLAEFGSTIFELPEANASATFVSTQSIWPADQLCPETQKHINDAYLAPRFFASGNLSPGVPCPLPGTDTQTLLKLADLPLPIRQALSGEPTGTKIDMAERDAMYQETDEIDMSGPPLSLRRFIQEGQSTTYSYVWYEEGGMSHSYHIMFFTQQADSGEILEISREWAATIKELCPLTLQLLAAQRH